MDKTFDLNLCRVIAGRRYKKFGGKKKEMYKITDKFY